MKKVKCVFDDFLNNAEETIGKTEEIVEERISLHIEDYLNSLVASIDGCESPIERIFALELGRVLQESKLNLIDYIDWTSQHEITVYEGAPKEKKYRVDFLIRFARIEPQTEYLFAIECDGHDFHEKTKEQAAKDKQRDRNLMSNGIMVIRFTGSEIHDDPYGCARDAVEIIEHYVLKMYR